MSTAYARHMTDIATTRRTVRREIASEPDLPDAIRAISALGNLFNSSDTFAEESALDAFQAGREAYWSKAGYSNQIAGIVLLAANRGGLASALRAHANDDSTLYARRTPYLLGTLIPLNKPAMEALHRAWLEWDETQPRRPTMRSLQAAE